MFLTNSFRNVRQRTIIKYNHSKPRIVHKNYSSFNSTTIRKSTSSKGICGLYVSKPSEMNVLTEKALLECSRIIESLKDYQQMKASQIVQQLDKISDLVCSVADPCELILNVSVDPKMTEAASKSCERISSAIVDFNTNPLLYEATRYALENAKDLSSEEFEVCSQLFTEFVHQGCHLDSNSKKTLQKLQEQLYYASEIFKNHFNDIEQIEGRIIKIDSKIASKFKPSILRLLRKKDDHYIYNSADGYINNYILNHADDSDLRKDVFTGSKEKFLQTTEKLLFLRKQVANHLSFPSYSDYYAWHRSLKKPQEIFEFLSRVNSEIKEKAENELEQLKILKKPEQSNSNGQNTEIFAWDYEYYKSKYLEAHKSAYSTQESRKSTSLKNSILDPLIRSTSNDNQVDDNIDEYFTIGNVLRGICQLWSILFKVKVDFIFEGISNEIWDPSVFKVEFYDEMDGKYLGNAYLDLFERQRKPGSANFPLRLRSLNGTPSVALVTNIPIIDMSNNIGSIFGSKSKSFFESKKILESPLLVPFEHVKILFHEMGHLSQGILCENKLQHFSGTRGLMDHVETPSQLFERFASDYRVLQSFAFHYKTGNSLTEEQLIKFLEKKSTFAALTTNRQVVLAALDQALHSSNLVKPRDSVRIANQVCQDYSFLKYPQDPLLHTDFGHLLGYGSVYYSYLYSNVSSAQIWHNLFEENPLSTKAGLKYRKEMLAYGGAKDPGIILQELTGSKADPKYFVKDMQEGQFESGLSVSGVEIDWTFINMENTQFDLCIGS